MQYNGQEVELITKGYWPEGVTLRAPNSDEWLEPTSELLEVAV